MKVLGIETSCDETGAAIVMDGTQVLANIVASQIPVHERYGGVVPELACRAHIVQLIPTIERALAQAGTGLSSVDGIAVTARPGLIGALLTGVQTAKAMAAALGKPVVGVNHLEAHLLSPLLAPDPPPFPFLALVASGGHTSLYVARAPGGYTRVAGTLDDAAGEALDKAGKMLGLPYPGGAAIDRLAASGNPEAFHFPQALPGRTNFSFSFSGLKTAMRSFLLERGTVPAGDELADVCASYIAAVARVLASKAVHAAQHHRLPRIALSGGVAASQAVRARLLAVAGEAGLRVHLVPLAYAGDNAAMVALAGTFRLRDGADDGPALDALARQEPGM